MREERSEYRERIRVPQYDDPPWDLCTDVAMAAAVMRTQYVSRPAARQPTTTAHALSLVKLQRVTIVSACADI